MNIHSTNKQYQLGYLAIRVMALMCASGSVTAAEDSLLNSGLSFWGATGAQSQFTAAQGPSLLRPPSSWSWDTSAPTLDLAAGVTHRFTNGLNLDLGMSLAHESERVETINYRDYFLGLSFGSLEGRLWYLPETAFTDEPSLYYEAGWQQPISEKLSFSLRLGQYSTAYNNLPGSTDRPSLSLGASTMVRGYGLGLRLIDHGGHMFGGEQDLRLMGSISKPLP